jgi:hypothetical protein
MDLEIWEQLRAKWMELESRGYQIKVDFNLIADPNDEKNILAIDVVQQVDHEIFTETLQRRAGEGYARLGLAGLSRAGLEDRLKERLHELYQRPEYQGLDLIVSLVPTSPTSGEVRAYWEVSDILAKRRLSVPVDYRIYYVLNALREQVMAAFGTNCKKVEATYNAGDLDFYFEQKGSPGVEPDR